MPRSSLPLSSCSRSKQFRVIRALRNRVRRDNGGILNGFGRVQEQNADQQAGDRAERHSEESEEEEPPPHPERNAEPRGEGRDDQEGTDDQDGDSVQEENEDNEDGDNEDEGNENGEDNESEDGNWEDEAGSSDDDDGVENDFLENYGDRPLYNGAPLTVRESVALVLSFVLSHSITGSCIADMLTLIQLHCVREGLVKLSLYKLKRYFSFCSGPVNKMYYCSVCCNSLPAPNAVCNMCPGRKKVSYFLQVPLLPQLKKLYARPDFYNNLQYRFTRKQPRDGWMGDIYDGRIYREQAEQGFLSDPNNISFTYFSDGVPVFKSKNYSFWGFYLTINELPYKLRIKKSHTLLLGIWFGPQKPNANIFMHSFVEDFRRLYHGVEMRVAGQEEKVHVRGVCIGGVADTPARSTLYNTVGHNGFYGCSLCEIPGETVKTEKGETHAFRYQEHLRKRTVESMLEQAEEAISVGDFYMGVKGPTVLRLFVRDFVRGTGIDLMHLAMGILKKLFTLHFDSKHRDNGFSLRSVIGVVDFLISQLKPPKFIHRLPRSVEDSTHWKASEFKAWLFYYSVPILKDVMKPVYFQHYLKFVIAISYLSASCISGAMIDIAEQLLREFVKDFENLYGVRYCSINIHMLLHLADCVRELGPTWVYTCFPYENINGELLRTIHGKTNIDSQMARMHWQWLEFPSKLLLIGEGPVKDFCLSQKRKMKISERIFQSCYVVGAYKAGGHNHRVIVQGLQTANIQYTHMKIYNRLLKNSMIYESENYSRNLRQCSAYVAFQSGEDICYGAVFVFVKILHCECEHVCLCRCEHFAIVRVAEKSSNVALTHMPHISLKYLHRMKMTFQVRAVRVEDLLTVCFSMLINENLYIAEPVNEYENE